MGHHHHHSPKHSSSHSDDRERETRSRPEPFGERTVLVGEAAPVLKLEGVYAGHFVSATLPAPGKWTVLLFYPLDFTFVCPTEITALSDAIDRFKALGVELYGISVDSKFSHLAWTESPRHLGGVGPVSFALLSDLNREAARAYGVLREGVALRGLFLIDDEGIVQHATINHLAVGRNVEETLRLIEAFQYVKRTGEVCPVNWKPGQVGMKPNPEGLKEYAKTHG